MQLARQSIDYFQKPIWAMNGTQLDVIDRLKSSYARRKDCRNARMELPDDTTTAMLENFNDLFFFGVMPGFDFKWEASEKGRTFDFFFSDPVTGVAEITSDPHAWSRGYILPSRNHSKKRSRLSTLVHEICHGYLRAYTCDLTSCLAYITNLGGDGHGRAILLLATEMEEALLRILDLKILIGRFRALREHMREYGELPSEHGLESFGFRDEKKEKRRRAHRKRRAWKPGVCRLGVKKWCYNYLDGKCRLRACFWPISGVIYAHLSGPWIYENWRHTGVQVAHGLMFLYCICGLSGFCRP